MFAFINNQILNHTKAFLHVNDLSIQRGYGVFDFFKISDHHVFFLNDYLDRFFASAEALGLKVPLERKKLVQAIYHLIEKNNLKESGIKMILTGGFSKDGYQPDVPNLIMTHHQLSLPGIEQLSKGVKIITHEYVRDFPHVKTINYIMGISLLNKIKEHDASDVLYYKDGIVSEFPRCNFFIVKHDNTVITPKENVLSGITRKNVLKIGNQNYRAEEGTVTLEDIYNAKEAFLTSTTKRIIPITKINDLAIGDGKPGNVSLDILAHLIKLEEADQQENAYPRKFYGF